MKTYRIVVISSAVFSGIMTYQLLQEILPDNFLWNLLPNILERPIDRGGIAVISMLLAFAFTYVIGGWIVARVITNNAGSNGDVQSK